MENLTIQSVGDKKSGAEITKQVFMASGQAQSNSGSFISNLDSLVEENSKMASQNLNRQEAHEKEFNNMNSTRTLLQEEEEYPLPKMTVLPQLSPVLEEVKADCSCEGNDAGCECDSSEESKPSLLNKHKKLITIIAIVSIPLALLTIVVLSRKSKK